MYGFEQFTAYNHSSSRSDITTFAYSYTCSTARGRFDIEFLFKSLHKMVKKQKQLNTDGNCSHVTHINSFNKNFQ